MARRVTTGQEGAEWPSGTHLATRSVQEGAEWSGVGPSDHLGNQEGVGWSESRAARRDPSGWIGFEFLEGSSMGLSFSIYLGS